MQLAAKRMKPTLPPDLLVELEHLEDLPSPPENVIRIIELLRDPDADFHDLMDLIGNDSALAVKILKTANSATYNSRRQVTNLAQALLTLGQTTATTLALRFSIVDSLRTLESGGIDLRHYWCRSLLSATTARALGSAIGSDSTEELFLAALLQDIGMLVLDKLMPASYRELGDQLMDHDAVCECEIEVLGVDHSCIGAWLLKRWDLPAFIYETVRYSHDPASASRGDSNQPVFQCVSIANHITDMLLTDQREDTIAGLANMMQRQLNLDESATIGVLDEISLQIPDMEALFGMDILDARIANTIIDRARKILTTLREISQLQLELDSLENKSLVQQDVKDTDSLTGLRNRNFTDKQLAAWMKRAHRYDFPISLALIDVDGFKEINDSYGRAAGDEILKSAAQLMRYQLRDYDTLTRYGGDEFVLLLGGETGANARKVCGRILDAFRASPQIVNGREVELSISIGLVTFNGIDERSEERDLLSEADEALQHAKLQGRARVIVYDQK